MMNTVDIDWKNLGFNYIKTDQRYISYWKAGSWDEGTLSEDNQVHISEGSTALHYGQTVFETQKRNEGWNGMFKSSPSETGTYIYSLRYRTRGSLKSAYSKGSFLLIR